MRVRSLGHLPDHVLVAELASLVRRDRALTCELLLHLGEVDARRLYLPAAYPSMHAYCVGELGLSEAAALKRIRVARAARRFPAIFAALEAGRLTLTTTLPLTPHLESERAAALITAAEGLSRAGIERLIAEWFASGAGGKVAPGPVSENSGALAPGPVDKECHAAEAAGSDPVGDRAAGPALVLAAPGEATPARVDAGSARTRIAPIGDGRFSLSASIDQETHELLRYAQTLLGHAVPSGDVSEVLKRAAKALVEQLEKRRFAKASRHRLRRRSEPGPGARHIPAAVRGEVWERDGGRCTFTSEQGRRCDSDVRLEFDHILPVARGGASSADNLRLLCRAHNQHAADRVYGEDFMKGKREASRNSRARAATGREPVAADRQAAKRAPVAPSATADPAGGAAATPPRVTRTPPVTPSHAKHAPPESVVPWLRALGFRAEKARRGAEAAAPLRDAPLEDRVKLALSVLAQAKPRPPVIPCA